eukprot:scaffold66603_cov60-Phaeocystis_antarctica.AAC.2
MHARIRTRKRTRHLRTRTSRAFATPPHLAAAPTLPGGEPGRGGPGRGFHRVAGDRAFAGRGARHAVRLRPTFLLPAPLLTAYSLLPTAYCPLTTAYFYC